MSDHAKFDELVWMELYDSHPMDNGYIVRVPGGWIYNQYSALADSGFFTSTFVPVPQAGHRK